MPVGLTVTSSARGSRRRLTPSRHWPRRHLVRRLRLAGPLPMPNRSQLTIAIGGISHETHAFSPHTTTLADFEQRAMLTGAAMLSAARGADGVLGGIIETATRSGVALVPTL